MRVLRERPPLFDVIDQAFNIRGKQIVFAWGDRIYAPSGNGDLHPSIVAHERAHGERQLVYPGGVEAWWGRYIVDLAFRREEEIIGHKAELRWLVDHAGGRNQRRRHLSIVATKLSSPLYGPLMSKSKAREVLDVRP